MTAAARAREMKAGDMLPSFSLRGVNVPGHVSPWDYKQHKNLVLFFFHDRECAPCLRLLRELAQGYEEYRRLNAEILAIVSSELQDLSRLQHELQLPFPLLSDPGAAVFASYGEWGGGVRPEFGVFIADRWGALFMKTVGSDAERFPRDSEIRGWLSFIEIQCPECFPPEPWPGD
jgi:peroxiredoxin